MIGIDTNPRGGLLRIDTTKGPIWVTNGMPEDVKAAVVRDVCARRGAKLVQEASQEPVQPRRGYRRPRWRRRLLRRLPWLLWRLFRRL